MDVHEKTFCKNQYRLYEVNNSKPDHKSETFYIIHPNTSEPKVVPTFYAFSDSTIINIFVFAVVVIVRLTWRKVHDGLMAEKRACFSRRFETPPQPQISLICFCKSVFFITTDPMFWYWNKLLVSMSIIVTNVILQSASWTFCFYALWAFIFTSIWELFEAFNHAT